MNNRQPLEIFREITKIPRSTGDERAISDYIVQFGEEIGLEVQRDSSNNVVLRKPGTPGYENAPILVLQSHVDMVYIKTEDCPHDYKSPLVLLEDANTLKADRTSLGADNGIGMAYALALLDSTDLPHPPLEALFTAGEEEGMLGAMELTSDFVRGRRLLNLDTEEEGEFCVGCAGGIRIALELDCRRESVSTGCETVVLNIQGLKGGHSGLEIDRGRGNAIRLLGRTLHQLSQQMPLMVESVQGGSKPNAIPDRAEAILSVNKEHLPRLEACVEELQGVYRSELSASDPELLLTLTPANSTGKALGKNTLQQLLVLLLGVPTGVQSMSLHLPGLVESSNNLGVLRTEEDVISLACSSRSSVGSLKTLISNQIELLANAAGAKCTQSGNYPEWTFSPVSPLRDKAVEVYSKIHGEAPRVIAVHAGLECGYFRQMYPEMDILSLGPNISGAHTPQETLDIDSMLRVWEYVKQLAAELKD